MLSHSLDAVMPPNRRSSPNPKRRVGKEDKPRKTNMIAKITITTCTWDKNLFRGLITPQRSSYILVIEVTIKVGVSSTSLPLSKQPQRLLQLFTKKSRVIQTS